MSTPDLSQVYAALASKSSEPQVAIQSIQKLDGKSFKVLAHVHAVNTEEDFGAAIANMTEGKGRMVPGSFNKRDDMAVAIVVANAQSKPMDASFEEVSSTTALELASGTIWSVVTDGGNKRVVLESSDDLGDIFAERMAKRSVHVTPTIALRSLATATVANGDMVRYVDLATAQSAWGLVYRTEAGLAVVDSELTPKTVSLDAIVANVSRVKLPKELSGSVEGIMATAKLTPEQLNKVLAYLKQAYPKGGASDPLFNAYRRLANEAK